MKKNGRKNLMYSLTVALPVDAEQHQILEQVAQQHRMTIGDYINRVLFWSFSNETYMAYFANSSARLKADNDTAMGKLQI